MALKFEKEITGLPVINPYNDFIVTAQQVADSIASFINSGNQRAALILRPLWGVQVKFANDVGDEIHRRTYGNVKSRTKTNRSVNDGSANFEAGRSV